MKSENEERNALGMDNRNAVDKAEVRDVESGSCGCAPGGCCGSSPQGVGRREFLKMAGVGFISTRVGGRLAQIMAGPFAAEDAASGHLIPADKKLTEEWIRSLYARGTKEVFSGKSLDNIGMPCGGIGSGQMYLRGDGALGCWQVFNDAYSNWVEGTFSTYKHQGVAKPIDSGFAVVVDSGNGSPVAKTLDRDGFESVTFCGEYPIGSVRYTGPDSAVEVELEAFSPFIPLNAKDSGIPATVFHVAVENKTQNPLSVSTQGWLENGVCAEYARRYEVLRKTEYVARSNYALCLHSALSPEDSASAATQREAIPFETFEGDSYGAWQVEGDAFAKKVAPDAKEKPSPAKGFEGTGFADSRVGGDEPQGILTSAPFTINRRYINFLIGGGTWNDKTCMNLVVEGKAVRTAMGKHSETLAWHSWLVDEWEGKEARLVIVDRVSEGWGIGVSHIYIDQIEFSDTPRVDVRGSLKDAPDFGTLALACMEPATRETALTGPLPNNRPREEYVAEDSATYTTGMPRRGFLATASVKLAPGEKHVFTFVVAWHFPNQINGDRFVVTPWDTPPVNRGHDYENRFVDAGQVVAYVLDNHERLASGTRLWRDTYYDSTLPYWLLDRLHSTASYLATGTCQWWKNGRFWAYEGVACCIGTCSHVWNYAHSHARLFPELARCVREMQDFLPQADGGGFDPSTGLVGFRGDTKYAADGQCGTILKAYREHMMSADDSFLKRNWPSIKKALEFSIGRDGNEDGLIEDIQHNTYDINYFGANTFVGALYLAALRAGEEMANEMGDRDFAKKVRAIFEKGSKLSVERLWNGEYFVQEVDLAEHAQHQYKDGCLSDQLFGQGWAHQLGLGYIYPEDNVSKTLDSIWKYNWAPDVGPYNEAHKPQRWFITPGQAGLITCTWPKGGYLTEGTFYREEVWTGIEYQVAGHMIWEGKVTEGLALCRAVHDRYHPDLFNPYNEVECGDHYARAMASWGVYLALAGFYYHGPKGRLGFAPRITPENFKAAFTTAEAWIAYAQKREAGEQKSTVEIRWGTLKLASLSLTGEGAVGTCKATLNGQAIDTDLKAKKHNAEIAFKSELALKAGDVLEVVLS
ncbi:MAG: GH116 family glycosyl hydrolase [Candidatus Hydrogenedentales bacterium]